MLKTTAVIFGRCPCWLVDILFWPLLFLALAAAFGVALPALWRLATLALPTLCGGCLRSRSRLLWRCAHLGGRLRLLRDRTHLRRGTALFTPAGLRWLAGSAGLRGPALPSTRN